MSDLSDQDMSDQDMSDLSDQEIDEEMDEVDEEMDEVAIQELIANFHSKDSNGECGDINPRNYVARDGLKTDVELVNMTFGSDGLSLYRDGSVHGEYPAINLPEDFAKRHNEAIITIMLHEQTVPSTTKATTILAPSFKEDSRVSTAEAMRGVYKLNVDQTGIRLVNNKNNIAFKKNNRDWQLSSKFAHPAKRAYPQQIFVVTPIVDGEQDYSQSIRSLPFCVRSKQQPNHILFQSGEGVPKSNCKTKRKTTKQISIQKSIDEKNNVIARLQKSIAMHKTIKESAIRSCQFIKEMLASDNRNTYVTLKHNNLQVLKQLTGVSEYSNEFYNSSSNSSSSSSKKQRCSY